MRTVTISREKGQRAVRDRSTRCEPCGIRVGTTFSHRKPAGLGGSYSPTNGLRADGSGTTGCHGWIEGNPLAAERLGWRVPSHADPATIPAYVWTENFGRGWFLLTEDGGYLLADDELVLAAGFDLHPELPARAEWSMA